MNAAQADPELALRAAQGDRRAYTVLMTRHGGSLAQAARAFGMPETDVDDVVQESFIAAWRNLAQYDPARPFRGWLFRIAINKMRDVRRRRRVRAFLFGAHRLDERPDMADDAPDQERSAIAINEFAHIRAKLACLEGNLGEALVLTAIVGMTQPEAALALGISVKSIEGRVARARSRLAAMLDQEKLQEAEGKARRGA
ncbi:sigma-70 family RNA polymerase sigma factor [Novosphingobium sediminicola]|uniref:RNA polymerase sigma-70 factor (ECF subfamily) n=1 Tax=Novosphingobium sediminicola TaxID=563162 RepID=A0A7W6CJB0_9SPHN|nr:RNA polymerase sigma-70 factor (ECF subfamily) [Novosphingobium sediminicola]